MSTATMTGTPPDDEPKQQPAGPKQYKLKQPAETPGLTETELRDVRLFVKAKRLASMAERALNATRPTVDRLLETHDQLIADGGRVIRERRMAGPNCWQFSEELTAEIAAIDAKKELEKGDGTAVKRPVPSIAFHDYRRGEKLEASTGPAPATGRRSIGKWLADMMKGG